MPDKRDESLQNNPQSGEPNEQKQEQGARPSERPSEERPISRRGTAAMDEGTRREVARKGGAASRGHRGNA